MANIKFGNGWADARGKVGGVVYSRNRSGPYVRTYVKPTNPRTPAQVVSRNRFSYVSSSYRLLTDVQRQAWLYASLQVQFPNKVGDQITPTASQYFAKLNMTLLAGGGDALVQEPAELVAILGFIALSAEADGDIVGLLNGTLVDGTKQIPAGYAVKVSGTANLSSGITKPQDNQFRELYTIPTGGSILDQDFLTAYLVQFPNFVYGANVFLRAQVYNVTTGQKSVPLDTKVVVTPA